MKYNKIIKYSHSLLAKVMLIYLFIFGVPIIGLYTSLYGVSLKTSQKYGGEQLLASLQGISNTMDEIFLSVNFVQSQLQGNPSFSDKSFLLPSQDSDFNKYKNYRLRQEFSMELYKLYLSNSYLHSLELYNPYGDTYFGNSNGNTRQIIHTPEDSLIKEVWSDGTERSWILVESDQEGVLFTSSSRPFCSSNPSQHLFSRAAISADVFRARTRTYNLSQEINFLIRPKNQDWVLVSGPEDFETCQFPDLADSASPGWTAFTYQGSPYISAYYQSSYTGWFYGAVVPLNYYSFSMPLMTKYWLYFLGALSVIFVLTALFVSLYLIKPMGLISSKMRAAEHGDLSIRIYTCRRDELGYIGYRFNVLLDSLDKLIHENYETKLLKEHFELKFIQTQLKEHFIYNTLDSIHWIATRNHVPEISRIIFDLSKFFRLTLNNGSNYISIAEEAEVLKSYLALSNIRMDGNIKSQITIQPDLSEEQVIKYLFQPILENAVIHGLGPSGGGQILITFGRSKDRLFYRVDDDGTGIPPCELARIREAVQKGSCQDGYFAFLNLNRQMDLYFGENYTFEISSEPGHGTSVTLTFPSSLGKEYL